MAFSIAAKFLRMYLPFRARHVSLAGPVGERPRPTKSLVPAKHAEAFLRF
jgi:hypothetical protein